MKLLLNVLVCALAVLGLTQAANAADAVAAQGPIYTTTFIEVSPGAIAQTVAMLKEYREAARKEPGMMVADLYQEMATPSRFVTNEVWRDLAAYDAHAKATPRTQLFLRLLPIQYGPPDARTHIGYFIAPGGGAPTANSIIIMSHLDVTPNALAEIVRNHEAALGRLGEGSRDADLSDPAAGAGNGKSFPAVRGLGERPGVRRA